ncbi:hypothetical protein EFT43_05490 [Leuconostoc falkenbergense]|uniref:hypothetical protein n=1 Tax=Leuconostoc falkenbergense TaxID=2766470 RepID=UPI00166C70AE|nr:hypothetical protein [Leuconostoc falkenbergense]MCT4404351.1 hypothetical protein [Leuconostoc falkenbergense]
MMQFKDDIRIRQRRRQTRIHWARVWFLIIGAAIVLGTLTLGYFYLSLSPMRQAESRIEALVRQKSDIVTVTQVSVDYRARTTYAASGETASGAKKVAIVQDNKVKTYSRSDGMSNAQLRSLLLKTYHPKKLYSANISRYKKVLVWEISYKAQNNKLNYLTLDFKTGKVYRAISGM